MESDEILVERVRRSDCLATNELIRRYESAVFATAYGVLRDHHFAEDVTQESFLTAFRRIGSLRKANRFGGWLLVITKRQAIQMAKKWKRSGDLESFTDFPESGLYIGNREVSEHADLLMHVARLPDHERAVVALKNFRGHSVSEIAKITGRPIGTVTKQLSRAYARLRTCLKEIES